MKGYVEGRSPAAIFERYRNELWENCKALWTIWVPAQLVNFSVVPRHLRIPFGESAATQQQYNQPAAQACGVCCVVCCVFTLPVHGSVRGWHAC
jgi:hypothetical protein